MSYPGFAQENKQRLLSSNVKEYKTVAIYFKLANDEFEFGKHTSLPWPHDQREPNWKGKLLIPASFDSSTAPNLLDKYPESITAFYYRMSNGKIWIYGDEITYTGTELSNHFDHNDRESFPKWRENNTIVLQWLVDNYFKAAEKNYREYLIIFINRARPKFGYQGIAQLQTNQIYADSNNTLLLNGIYQTDCYSLPGTRHIVTHELGHRLFNLHHINGVYRWSLMSGAGRFPPEASGVTMSAYEKNKLGWLDFEIIEDTRYNIKLKNLTTSNKAIKIPFINSDGYFVIENRHYSEPFEPNPDDIDDLTHTLPGTGLLIYYVDEHGPHIIPADGQVRKVIIGRPPDTRTVYNGDNSDLFGNDGRKEILLHTNSLKPVKKKVNTKIAIKNIHYHGEDIIFDVIFNYDGKIEPHSELPSDFKLWNVPNPFKLNTRICYYLPQDTHVKLTILNDHGQEIDTLINQFQSSAEYEVKVEGHNYPSGTYFYRLETDTWQKTGEMILRKDY